MKFDGPPPLKVTTAWVLGWSVGLPSLSGIGRTWIGWDNWFPTLSFKAPALSGKETLKRGTEGGRCSRDLEAP